MTAVFLVARSAGEYSDWSFELVGVYALESEAIFAVNALQQSDADKRAAGEWVDEYLGYAVLRAQPTERGAGRIDFVRDTDHGNQFKWYNWDLIEEKP